MCIRDSLEEWTHKKSVADLAGAMSLNVDKVWLKTNGTEVLDVYKRQALFVFSSLCNAAERFGGE